MRTSTALFLSIIGVGVATFLPQLTSAASSQAVQSQVVSGSTGFAGLGQRNLIADTYFTILTDDSTGLTNQVLSSYRGDGTVDGVDSDDLGLGIGSLDSAAHGSWEVISPGEFETVLHYFTYDAAGTHLFTVRATVLGSSVNQVPIPGVPFDVTYVVDLFLPTQNPAIDVPAVPNFTSGSGQSWRMP